MKLKVLGPEEHSWKLREHYVFTLTLIRPEKQFEREETVVTIYIRFFKNDDRLDQLTDDIYNTPRDMYLSYENHPLRKWMEGTNVCIYPLIDDHYDADYMFYDCREVFYYDENGIQHRVQLVPNKPKI